MENLSGVFPNQTRKKHVILLTQCKIEFSLPFTGCGKVFAKVPVM